MGKGKCPKHSGCFNDELGIYGEVNAHGFCHCFLGFYMDNSTYPPTCHDMRGGGNCDDDGNGMICYENDKHWEWCPYCSAKKHHDDHGGDLTFGLYTSGEGNYNDDDPQLFRGGDDANCHKQRQADAYWYCWYDAYPDPLVPLDSIILEWSEPNQCEYLLYVYTPLACCFADPNMDPDDC